MRPLHDPKSGPPGCIACRITSVTLATAHYTDTGTTTTQRSCTTTATWLLAVVQLPWLPRQSGNRKGLIGYLPLDAVRFTDETVSGTFLHGVKTVRHVFAQCENSEDQRPITTRHNPTPTDDEFRRPHRGRPGGGFFGTSFFAAPPRCSAGLSCKGCGGPGLWRALENRGVRFGLVGSLVVVSSRRSK